MKPLKRVRNTNGFIFHRQATVDAVELGEGDVANLQDVLSFSRSDEKSSEIKCICSVEGTGVGSRGASILQCFHLAPNC